MDYRFTLGTTEHSHAMNVRVFRKRTIVLFDQQTNPLWHPWECRQIKIPFRIPPTSDQSRMRFALRLAFEPLFANNFLGLSGDLGAEKVLGLKDQWV